MVKPISQKEKFEEAARELETDDDEKEFDRVLKRVAVVPPPPKDDKRKKSK